MTEEQLKEYLTKNLTIRVSRFDSCYITVDLLLNDDVISSDMADVPDFRDSAYDWR